MCRFFLLFIGFVGLNAGAAWAQNTLPQWPKSTDFVLRNREPLLLNLDSLKRLVKLPTSVKDDEITGRMVVRVLFDDQGHYVQHIVLKDPHPIFTQVAEPELPCLRIEPVWASGKPSAVWLTFPFRYLPAY